MSSSVLQCPNCGTDLTEALAKQLREDISADFRQKFLESKKQLEEQMSTRQQLLEKDIEHQRRTMEHMRRDAQDRERQREVEFDTQLKQQAEQQLLLAEQKAKERIDTELISMREQIEEQRNRIKEQTHKEVELLRQQRELEQQREQLQLEIQRQLNEERGKVRDQLEQQFVESARLRDAEKDKRIDDMQKLIEDLQRKSQQGSQQTQGEVLELELENSLRAAFIYDDIKPVPKGVKGADVVQRVIESGRDCGTILWESKRTKSWSKDWIPKLKEDLRELRANVAVVVSTVLPEGIRSFGLLDGVWVCDLPYAIPLAVALREGVIDVSRQRTASEGKSEKMEMLYHYLTGQEFAHHMQSMMEVIVTMRKELDDEKRAYEKIWSKREKQIERTQRAAIRIHGDLEGIVGKALANSALQLPDGDEE